MSEPSSFGRWLQDRRRALDLTQRELAQQVGCSAVTVHKLETGALHPSKDMAERLAICLGISPQSQPAFVRFARGGQLDSALEMGQFPATSVSHPANNLPFPATQLIGREADLTAIRKRLRDGARLITLVGPPGIGKTRLALEMAYQSLEAYSDGVFFVYLAPVADATLVADAIGQTLNIPEARARPMAEQIKSYLREEQVLLILDNFEHVAEAAPLAAELLAACPWLTMVITSRQPLRIHGERQYPLNPLTVPESGAIGAAAALQYSAIALFVERAEAAAPGFVLTDTDAANVAEICRRLDGVPLAIELVAAHMRFLSPGELLERWSGSWVLSSGWLRDAPPRHQTLQDAIDWSCRLLSESEKLLLYQLAVFARGADLRAIEAVCDCQSLEVLASLTDKSLVKRVAGPDGEGRFVLLEMIREYAAAHLAGGDDEEQARSRHAAYYCELATEGRAGMNGPNQLAWFQRLEMEQPNLRAALDWTLSRDPDGQRPAVELGLRMAADLFWFWYLRGHLREGLDWLERGLTATKDWGATLERANALWATGACAGYLALGRRSRTCLDASVQACLSLVASDTGRTGTPDDLAAARRALGYALQFRSFFATGREDLAKARTDLESSVAIFREIGDEFEVAHALNSLGHWASRNGELQVARPALEESLALFRRAGNLWGGGLAVGNLIRVYEYEGTMERFRPEAAALIADIGVQPAIVRELGEVIRMHVVMWWLCYLAGSEGDDAHRIGVFQQAVGQQRALGYQSFVDSTMYEASYLAFQAEMPARAVRLTGATKAWLQHLGLSLEDPPDLAAALAGARGQLGEASFARAWAEGCAMTVSELAAYALRAEE